MEYAGDDFPLLLKAKPFIDLLDYVRDEPYGSRCARAVLTAVIRMFEVGSVYDFVITEQVRVIDRIVSSALDRPLLSSDPDRHLAFLCHARSVLFQSDGCIAHVVTLMMSFAFRFYLSQRSSSRKADFMRAVIANLFVTILSLSDPVLQFKFSLRTVYLSLLAKSIPQTEALLGFCLEILESLPLSASECVPLFKQFLAVLVFVPDVPQRPVLSVFTAFVNVIERYVVIGNFEKIIQETTSYHEDISKTFVSGSTRLASVSVLSKELYII
ncbi:unnamed protein product [Heligmosomoides polygyrus]|uniref:MOR2-PAG1_C domain-containing protein n=1 Tax=Heligmosomoides polygyrus TaxID=6339 RepID=A0A183GEU2_HELPZ|nr:unnamed protein product [Heligmosomoides polygyrus]